MSGWIKLDRNINNHWVFKNSDYFKWWVDILLEVNHTPAKVIIKNKIYDCGRGEKLYSLDTWASRWNTNKSKVRRFFELLQKENMIELKSETQTTRLKVCKYDDYQEIGNANETQMKRKRNANETHLTPIQERKEEREEEEEKYNKEKNKNEFFKKDLLFSSSWIEQLAMNNKNKFNIEEIKEKLNEFTIQLNLKLDFKINKKDFTHHFVSWLDKQEKPQKQIIRFNSPIL